MTAFVDTNVLIRHLTGDPPAQARRATRFLEETDELLLADVMLAGVGYVLESFYELGRAQVADTLRAILAYPGGYTESGMRYQHSSERPDSCSESGLSHARFEGQIRTRARQLEAVAGEPVPHVRLCCREGKASLCSARGFRRRRHTNGLA